MSRLINSIPVEIPENITFYETAREIWNATRDILPKNTSELFEIEDALHELRQGDL